MRSALRTHLVALCVAVHEFAIAEEPRLLVLQAFVEHVLRDVGSFGGKISIYYNIRLVIYILRKL